MATDLLPERLFACRLREQRESLGLSQTALARQIPCSRKAISNYETGCRWPDIHNLCRLAEVLGCTVDYLLGRTAIAVDWPLLVKRLTATSALRVADSDAESDAYR